MNLILSAHEIGASDLPRVGGKALALAALSQAGFRIPDFLCVTTDAYSAFLDGTGLRQLTDSEYDDIDPIYLPDGHILFTTTRGNSYVRCGPFIYSYILARCDADGRNVYLISHNGEPDFVPALLNDGRVVYSRWEYSDKDQNRVQSLWTTFQDGHGPNAPILPS